MTIELTGVHKSYPTRQGFTPILKNVNLHVAPGEHVGILGQNGSGKSTLIRILGGTERPTSGTVHRGMSVSWPLAFGGAFLNALTGLDNVRFVCRLYGVDPNEKLGFVQDFTELGKYLREPVKSYSSGMRARLAFAVSMAVDFDCYLIDEIVAVGDDRFHRKCQLELFEKRAHKAMLIVSHSPEFIRDHCHKASVLTAGELTNFDDVEEAYRFYASHELTIQPHMVDNLAELAVHLPGGAMQLVADEHERGASADEFQEFLASHQIHEVPIFDSCDLVGQLDRFGKPEAATAVSEFLTDRRPDEPLFWITLGDLYCQRRQHIPGVDAYREAVRLDPSSYWGNRNLASELFSVGRYEEAIPIYERAMEVAPSSEARLELQLRWLDSRIMLDRVTTADRIEFSVPAASVVVVDQSCSALRDGRAARMAVAGLTAKSPDASHLVCTFRAGEQSWQGSPSLARNSIRRLASCSGTSAFAYTHYATIDDAVTEIEFEIRDQDKILFKGIQPVRRIDGHPEDDELPPLEAARRANWRLRAEDSALFYGLSEQAGSGSDIVPFAENLITASHYDEAEMRLRHWLGTNPHDHPDRSFVIDLVCVETSRARLPGWRDELDQLLAAERQAGESASILANLGHARIADDDHSGAAAMYQQASRMAAGHDIIHFARGIHTAKLATEVARPGPSPESDGRGGASADIVQLFACDSKYFQRFGRTLVASSRERSGQVDLIIHAHIIDPDAESLELAKRLQQSLDLKFTTEASPPQITQETIRRAYFTCARFLMAPQLVREYNCPVLITEADCLMNWQWQDLLQHIEGADVGHVQSSMWTWVPWTKIPAGIFLIAPTEAGLEHADYIARFIRHAFEREGSGDVDLWTVDQVALWLSRVAPPEAVRSVHLPMASVLTLATGDKGNVLAT